MKALSLFLVLSGVLLYTASSRTRLNRPAQVCGAAHCPWPPTLALDQMH